MKKSVISIILVFALLLPYTCLSVSAGISTSKFETANKVLTELGFISDKSDKLSNTVSRGEFTAELLKIMNIKSSSQSVVFADIDETNDYYTTMSAAYSVGLLNSTMARPSDKITYNEAVKMLVCMLGYENYALQLGGWPAGYIRVANEADLTDGINIYDAPLAVRDEVSLIFNAINCDVMEITGISDGVIYQKKKGKTILEQYHGIIKSEGLAEGISSKKLYKNDYIEPGEIKIGGYTYNINADGLSEYIGLNINFYYKSDTDEVVAYYCDEGTIVTLNTDDLYELNNKKIKYADESGSVRTLTLSSDVILLYNNFPSSVFDSSLFMNKDGIVSFADNNADNKIDCIFVDVTEDYVVKSVDTNKGIVYDLYTPGKYVSVSEKTNDSVSFEDEYGNKMYPGELFKYDVISVKKSLDGESVIALYSGREIYGTVEAIEINDNRTYLTIDSVVYQTTAEFASYEKINVGDSGIFAMNILGKIATVNREFSDTETVKIGYLIDVASKSGLNSEYLYKILEANGNIIVAESATKIRLDEKNLHAKDAYTALLQNGEVISQPIRYDLNADGELRFLDTIELGNNESPDSLTPMYSCYYDMFGNARPSPVILEWRSGNKIFGSKVAASSDTVVFSVPETKTGNDDDYIAYTVSYFVGNEDYSIESYKTIKDSLVADVITVRNTGNDKLIGTRHGISAFVSKREVITEDGDEKIVVTLMGEGGENDYYVEDVSVLSDIHLIEGDTAHTLANGDVVRVAYNADNEISDVELIYDRAGDKFKYPDTFCNVSAPNEIYRVSYNEIYSMYQGYILVAKGEVDPGVSYSLESLECYPANKYNIIVYDSASREDNKLSLGSVTDLIDYETAGKGSEIVLYTSYTTKGTIVVYK